MRKDGADLTEKQAIFVKEYLISLNGTDAAKKAGYSPRIAHSQANRLLKGKENSKVLEAINKGMAKREKKLGITADNVLANLILAADIALGKEDTHCIISGESTPLKKTDLNAFVKVQELFLKHLSDKTKDEAENNYSTKNLVKIEIVKDERNESN